MLRQPSLLLSLLIALFVSISSVWAKNVTVFTNDKRLTFSNASTTKTNDWDFDETGLCTDNGGYSRTYTNGAWMRLRFNGTAAYVVFAECNLAAPTNVTIDDAQATVQASNSTFNLYSQTCQTRTLFATGLANTNHTITVAYAGPGSSSSTVLNKFVYDDGGDTPKADPTATRASFTISDTGASSSATPSASAASENSPGCGTGCKTASISGVVGTIIAVLFWVWCFRACCCRRRTEVTTTVFVTRPPSPKPQPIILLAATYEVQQTHIQVNRVDRDSAVVPAPPAYAAEQTNYK